MRIVTLFDRAGTFLARVEIPSSPSPAYVVTWEGRTFVCGDTKPEHYREAIAVGATKPGDVTMVRAKFTLSEVTEMAYGSSKKFVFTPQYDTSIPEDQRFAKASPSGRFEIYVDNPAAAEQFKLGQAYYLDFTAVPAPEAKPEG